MKKKIVTLNTLMGDTMLKDDISKSVSKVAVSSIDEWILLTLKKYANPPLLTDEITEEYILENDIKIISSQEQPSQWHPESMVYRLFQGDNLLSTYRLSVKVDFE